MPRPVPYPWHDLTEPQKTQAKRDGLGKPTTRGVFGREIIEAGWRWIVNDRGVVIAVKPTDVAHREYFRPALPRKRIDGEA